MTCPAYYICDNCGKHVYAMCVNCHFSPDKRLPDGRVLCEDCVEETRCARRGE